MQNNQGTIGLPYESIYDEILAKATSSQHGYTDEEVNNVLKEMQERYHKRYPGERYDLYFHDIAFPNQPWLAESWAWIHLYMRYAYIEPRAQQHKLPNVLEIPLLY
ncbi:hypothetical protein BofuT4_P105510.1 [Botrytis cinerea T4]|uniref:Uncharacterized protein n=1 Tax=Botryotinia fuckeliana (strain T4) TaxID=999810 RepID=G2Y8I6_BOTF4|nr:hypothetical protein BofuT4_P105510.1 [Botrytis cinerea T4]